MKQKIYLIRHGQTEYNKQFIIQGSGVDSSLNDRGLEQGQLFYKKYKTVPFDLIITSNLQRTWQTVQAFIDDGIVWEKDADINEISWGTHEGKKATLEMRDQYVVLMKAWSEGDFDVTLPEAETATELISRLSRFVEHLKKRKEETILVCSHGRAMRALVCLMQNKSPRLMDTIAHSNTGLYLFERNEDSFELKLENDRTHLETSADLEKK